YGLRSELTSGQAALLLALTEIFVKASVRTAVAHLGSPSDSSSSLVYLPAAARPLYVRLGPDEREFPYVRGYLPGDTAGSRSWDPKPWGDYDKQAEEYWSRHTKAVVHRSRMDEAGNRWQLTVWAFGASAYGNLVNLLTTDAGI